MPRRPRASVTATFFHVINRSISRTTLFQSPRDYRAFRSVLDEGLKRHPVRLLAYCVLPNHWHLIVSPAGTKELSQLMQWVTATHAIRWQRRHDRIGRGHVYQARFKSHAIDAAAHLVRAC